MVLFCLIYLILLHCLKQRYIIRLVIEIVINRAFYLFIVSYNPSLAKLMLTLVIYIYIYI